MLTTIWNMITNNVSYQDPGPDYYHRLNPDRTRNRAVHQLRELGYEVTLCPTHTPG